MPVEITMTLSPELQAVADAREEVAKCQLKIEKLKLSIKLAKDEWSEAVGRMNERLDDLIQKERQPTLFDRYRDPPAAVPDDRNPEPDPPAPPAPETADDEPVAGEPAAGEPGWRKLYVAEEFDASPLVFDRLGEAKVETLGQLADALLAGQTFDLPADNVAELKDGIRDASQEDAEPIRFTGDQEEPATDDVAAPGGFPQRSQFPDDKTGSWAFKHASARHFGNSDPEQDRIDGQIADYRDRQASGTAQSAWGKWSEFDVSITTPDGEHTVRVLYKPDWTGDPTRDHIEAWGPLSPTNYFSDVITNLKGKRPKLPLAEWCREWAQQQADNFVKESKKSRGRGAGKKEPARKGA